MRAACHAADRHRGRVVGRPRGARPPARRPATPLGRGDGAAKGRRPPRGAPVPVARRRAQRRSWGRNLSQNAKGPQGAVPPRASLGAIEKRPPRARRPALPQPRAAVLSAKAGLTAGFGMGSGDPRLCGRARGGRSPAAQMYSSLPGTPLRGDPGGRMAGTGEDDASRSVLSSRMRRARAISAARLSASPRLHLRPIDQVVYLGPYRKVDSSRRRLPA